MQERYLGDSHDFVKYSLLRFLGSQMGLGIGINWYLTCPDALSIAAEAGHGEKRQHLSGRDWSWDDDLKARLSIFGASECRSFETLADSGALPAGTMLFDDPVPSIELRPEWNAQALERLREANLVFLDPDVGLEVQSMTAATSKRYAFFREVAAYRSAGKIAVTIQFARQCDPIKRAQAVRARLAMTFPEDERLPVLRARTSPNVLFIFSSPVSLQDQLSQAVHAFAAQGPAKLEIIS